MALKVKLKKPVEAHGKEISAIELTEPTGKDVRLLGIPLIFHADGNFEIKSSIMAKYISTLGQVPLSTVDKISPSDFVNVATELLPFFAE